MELVSAYLYNASPIPTKNISPKTFHNLKRNDWYRDLRASKKFQILNKRFKIKEQWYRVIIRFQLLDDMNYELNMPMPFIIAETYTADEVAFKDTKVLHGRKVGNTIGYLEHGIPVELIDEVIHDLKACMIYKDGSESQEILKKQVDIDLEF